MVSKELSTVEFPASELTKSQSKIYGVRTFEGFGIGRINLRFDDSCNNGHNTFAMTVSAQNFGGCMHDEIAKVCPELRKYIKWHLCSTDGPLYYIENTIYHIREGKIGYARMSAIWDGMPEDIGTWTDHEIKVTLIKRLPQLMEDFRADMIELGFKY